MDNTPPNVSFIGIVDFSQEARWIYLTESSSDLLGYEPKELMGRPSLELVHPDEFPAVRQIHYDTIRQDKAAVIAYLRMKHKDPYRGYVLCGISRTVVHNVLVGSISFASPGAKALHNASTAQEITVITTSAKDFQFRRWGDPSPMPPSPMPSTITSGQFPSPPSTASSPSSPRVARPITFDPLPSQSIRTALILDRFSVRCPIHYCSNDLLVPTTDVMGRPFYDFVAQKDEEIVRSWIDAVKSWGVNERGAPSDGGFGFGRFTLLPKGRDSSQTASPEHSSSRHRDGGAGVGWGSKSRPKPSNSLRPSTAGSSSTKPRLRRHSSSSNLDSTFPHIDVDAIFSAHSDGLMVILRQAT